MKTEKLTNRRIALNQSYIVQDKINEITELMAAGFYPEDYNEFTRKIEDRLNDINNSVETIVNKVQ